ncbi:MAG: nucleotide exchange factor GrpE [Alphaproteobacteria bacterium]|nr:nucleotide exchange factor GrpE [Alphaproteobacteria bacterium]
MSDQHEDDLPETEAAANGAEQADAELARLRSEIAELKDRALRALAEAENTRRRAEREKKDASLYAVTAFARDMLQVADNFARAIQACPADVREAAAPQLKAVIEGVEVTDRQLMSTLERHGIRQIDTSSGKFDPNLHQAIAEVPGRGKPAGSIVDVVQVGYQIGDRLLRPAMVTVARQETGSGQEPGAQINTEA